MSNLPPPAAPQTLAYSQDQQDTENLRILSICWYVLAALQGLVACLFLIYIAAGAFMAIMGTAAGAGTKQPIFAIPFLGMGAMFACFGAVPLILIGTIAFMSFTVARSLKRRKSMTLCYVMAAIACIFFPAGTALGIFTFFVLGRPSVKASFYVRS